MKPSLSTCARINPFVSLVLLWTLWPVRASAQEGVPSATAPSSSAPNSAAIIPSPPPPPRAGFQASLRGGYAHPSGFVADERGGYRMADYFSDQVAFTADVGWKPVAQLFLGGYLGLGFGGTAGEMKRDCYNARLGCSAADVRVGAEIQYAFLPGGLVNPWIGYGIGYESASIGLTDGKSSASFAFTGPEYIDLMAGVDLRVLRELGIGPFVEITDGVYTSARVDQGTFANGEISTSREGTIARTGWHQWFRLGIRAVLFP